MESIKSLFRIEHWKKKILEDREVKCRLKNKAIWLECGDDNIKLFQAYAKCRKMGNTIWNLSDQGLILPRLSTNGEETF